MHTMRNNSDQYWDGFNREGDICPEESFLGNWQTLKGLLIEQNYSSIQRMKLTNHNFNEAYAYLKSILRHTNAQNERLQSRVQQLQEAIAVIDPQHPILTTNTTNDLRSPQKQWQEFKTVPMPTHNAWNSAQRILRTADTEEKEGKQKMKKECGKIRAFVWQQLQGSIVFDAQNGSAIPKEMVVRLYERWSQLNGHQTQIKPCIIKSLLTSEIKRMLPALQHCEQFYLGVSFRQDLTEGLKSKQKGDEDKSLDGQDGGLLELADAEEELELDF